VHEGRCPLLLSVLVKTFSWHLSERPFSESDFKLVAAQMESGIEVLIQLRPAENDCSWEAYRNMFSGNGPVILLKDMSNVKSSAKKLLIVVFLLNWLLLKFGNGPVNKLLPSNMVDTIGAIMAGIVELK
jgi:hypothetical protein